LETNTTIIRARELEAANKAVHAALNKLTEQGHADQDLSNTLLGYALSSAGLHHARQTLGTRRGAAQKLRSFIIKTGVHPLLRRKLEIPLKNSGVLNDQQKSTATAARGSFSLCAKPSGKT
jgi:hypothetical protein